MSTAEIIRSWTRRIQTEVFVWEGLTVLLRLRAGLAEPGCGGAAPPRRSYRTASAVARRRAVAAL
jgi:hypothetical protein